MDFELKNKCIASLRTYLDVSPQTWRKGCPLSLDQVSEFLDIHFTARRCYYWGVSGKPEKVGAWTVTKDAKWFGQFVIRVYFPHQHILLLCSPEIAEKLDVIRNILEGKHKEQPILYYWYDKKQDTVHKGGPLVVLATLTDSIIGPEGESLTKIFHDLEVAETAKAAAAAAGHMSARLFH